jgi:hypothetical protein
MIFSIQRCLEDYIERCGLADTDQYALRLAKLYDRERYGKTTAVFLPLMRRIRTVFYRTNPGTQRDGFERKVLALLDGKFKKKEYSSFQKQSLQELKRQATAY